MICLKRLFRRFWENAEKRAKQWADVPPVMKAHQVRALSFKNEWEAAPCTCGGCAMEEVDEDG